MQPVSLVKQRHLQRFVARGTRFIQKRPLIAKSLPTAVGFAFGDFLTQTLNQDKQRVFSYDYGRTVKMGTIGLVMAGPVGLAFLRWMETWVMPATPYSVAALSIKFTLDQVLGCAIWQAALLSIHKPYRQALYRHLSAAKPAAEPQQQQLSATS